MRYLDIRETAVDGEGLRLAIYFSGCENKCPGCFNPESWDYEAGEPFTDELLQKIIKDVKNNPMLDGVSLLGGDPFAPRNRKELVNIVKTISAAGINIWCWTGYTYEELLNDHVAAESLTYINVLVDGRFVEELKAPELQFRGSSNQKIIRIGK